MAAGNAGFIVIFLPQVPVVGIFFYSGIGSSFFGCDVAFDHAGILVFKFGTGVGDHAHIPLHDIEHGGFGSCLPGEIHKFVVSVNHVDVGVVTTVGEYAGNAYCPVLGQVGQGGIQSCGVEEQQFFLQSDEFNLVFGDTGTQSVDHFLEAGNKFVKFTVISIVKGFVSLYYTGQVFNLAFQPHLVTFHVQDSVLNGLGIFNVYIPQVLGFGKVQVQLSLAKVKDDSLYLQYDPVQCVQKGL